MFFLLRHDYVSCHIPKMNSTIACIQITSIPNASKALAMGLGSSGAEQQKSRGELRSQRALGGFVYAISTAARKRI